MKKPVPSWFTFLATVLLVVGAITGFWQFIEARADTKALAGVDAAKKVSDALEEHRLRDDEVHKALLRAVERGEQRTYELQLDTRAVYQHQLWEKRQPRLERTPAPPASEVPR